MDTDMFVYFFLATACAIGCFPILLRYIREQKDPRGPSRRAVSLAIAGEIGLVLFSIAAYGIGTVQQRPYLAERQTKQNMKAITQALLQYSEDWQETLPPANRWQDAISQPKYFPGLDYSQVLTCPTDGTPRVYAINSAVAGHKIREIAFPDKTVLLFEAKKSSRNASGSLNDLAPTMNGVWTFGFCDGWVVQKYPSQDEAMQWTIR